VVRPRRPRARRASPRPGARRMVVAVERPDVQAMAVVPDVVRAGAGAASRRWATLRICIPRQMPSTGMSRSTRAGRARSRTRRARAPGRRSRRIGAPGRRSTGRRRRRPRASGRRRGPARRRDPRRARVGRQQQGHAAGALHGRHVGKRRSARRPRVPRPQRAESRPGADADDAAAPCRPDYGARS
jgi:hypothetical protein